MGATEPRRLSRRRVQWLTLLITAALSSVSLAAVLPEDRADAMYHSYDGGGVTIDGPSVLVRKEFADKFSVSANYYVDKVTGASIDVVASGASAYVEERTETSVGVDYLYDRTLMSLSATQSTENDYEASAVSFGISQDFFGDMTTLSFGYTKGDDTVRRNDDPNFEAELERQRYRLSVTQVLTKNWIVALNAEAVVDEGYLNNPYRVVRYLDANGGYGWQREEYPHTRNSDAFSIRSMFYLPYRAAIKGEYRLFNDSWGIEASNAELAYIHPIHDRWTFEVKYRVYDQTQADFYSDLFPYINAQNFMARDKELSTFSNSTYGLGITYEIDSPYLSAFNSSSINLFWDHIVFDYDNFRDARIKDVAPGEEPLYEFDANVVRLFLSVTY